MKTTILRTLGASHRGKTILENWSRMKRAMTRYDQALCRDFLAQAGPRNLHIGGGWHRLPGWLNTDINPIPGVMYMDATCPFPLSDSSVDAVYSEHMIEHIPYQSGLTMLGECFRVLRHGKTIRVVTPDLRVVLSLADAEGDAQRSRYLVYFCNKFFKLGTPQTWDQAINTFFYSWGHRFLYIEETLRASLEASGFENVRRTALNESEHTWLRGLANDGRHSEEGFLDFISLTVEARKP